MKKILGNTAYAALAQISGRGTFVILSIILARSLSPSDFASFSYFQMTVNMIAAYAAVGVSVASARSFASIETEKERAWEEILVLWIVTFVAIVFIIFLLWILQSLILSENSPFQWWHLALAIAAVAIGIVPAGGIYGRELFREGFQVSIIVFIITIAGAILAHEAGSLAIAIWTLTLAYLMKSLGETFAVISNSEHISPHFFLPQDFAPLKRVLSILGPMAIVSVLAASGAWIVGRILLETNGEREFALYAIGLQWYSLGLFVPGIITRVLFAKQVHLSKDKSSTGGARRLQLIKQGIKSILVSSLLFAAVGTILSSELIKLYGGSYNNEGAVISAFLLAAVPIAAANHVGNALVANERQHTWLILTIVWLALQAFGAFYLSPLGFISGAISIGGAGLFLFLSAYHFTNKYEASA